MAKKMKKKSSTPVLSLVTPSGTLQWPKLYKPETSFGPPGFYSTDFIMKIDAPGVKELIQKIEDFGAEYDAGEHRPYTIDEDAGTVTLKAKAKVSPDRDRPPVVDAKRNIIDKDPNIGNGSIAKLSVAVVPYEQQGGGLTCYLRATQILEIKHYTPGIDAFGEEEGGYEYGNSSCDSGAGDSGSDDYGSDKGVSDDEF